VFEGEIWKGECIHHYFNIVAFAGANIGVSFGFYNKEEMIFTAMGKFGS
jgi:hypothetical protein